MKLTKEEFSEKVEIFAIKSKAEIIDATLHIATQNGIEPEMINKFLSERLKELIRNEAMNKNMIAKEENATLPI